MSQNFGMQMIAPMTRAVKMLLIINLSLWVGLVLIIQNFFMDQPYIFRWFGLSPDMLINNFWIWQPFTYMFFHSDNIFHVLLNMLVLWMFGAELETRWGAKAFLFYYIGTGLGAALIYLAGILTYFFLTGNFIPMTVPVVGASGAIFGLMVAYGILFGDRVIYFMMLFPMKAKFFVLIIGLVEVANLLTTGMGGQVANLAHIGGLLSGFLILFFWGRWKGLKSKSSQRHGRRLKLVVDNERKPGDQNGPRFWN